jgi:hypothetical protein
VGDISFITHGKKHNLQVFQLQNGIVNWDTFISAVLAKFGASAQVWKEKDVVTSVVSEVGAHGLFDEMPCKDVVWDE